MLFFCDCSCIKIRICILAIFISFTLMCHRQTQFVSNSIYHGMLRSMPLYACYAYIFIIDLN